MSIVLACLRFSALLFLSVAGAWLTHPPPADTQPVGGEAAARALCTTCHKLPPPDTLPKSAWRDELARMFLIQSNQPEPIGPPGTAARMVTLPPDWQSILGYYEANAPGAA